MSRSSASPASSTSSTRALSARPPDAITPPIAASAAPDSPPGGAPQPSGAHHALAAAFDRLQVGVIIATASGHAAVANAYARRLFQERDGLMLGDHGLEAHRASDTRTLRDVIGRAARRELDSCATLQLARSQGPRALVVHVPADPFTGAADDHAVVFVCDPSYEPAVDRQTLIRLFGFTRAEATLALLLMSGKTVEQAAESLFVSPHTVRTHLKRMLLKTDTGRQAELLRLLLTCAAQVRLD